jgi:hypothetical protein
MKKVLRKAKFAISFAISFALLLDDSALRTSGEHWWTNKNVFPVDIIPPRFSMHMYHLGDEQLSRWWPQVRDVVTPHRHDNHRHRHQ